MEESNPWPTFVDAFSTVLCIFIFLMLIFVLNSMLIMFESSKKHYVPANGVTHSSISNLISTEPTDASSLSKENLEGDKSSSAGAQATSKDNSPAQQSSEATKPETLSQKSKSDTVAQATPSEAATPSTQTVVELAQPSSSTTSSAAKTGHFDINDNQKPTFEIKGERFIIHFTSMEQGYSEDVMNELHKWLTTNGKKPVSVVLYTPDAPSVSVSDAMRLAYQRGIILLKTVKNPYPGQEVAFSVINNPAVMSNSAVVTVGQ